MMSTIQLPYSSDRVIVESRKVPSLMNLSIVNMTPACARELGAVLLDASMDQHEAFKERTGPNPHPGLVVRARQAIEHKINMSLPLWMQIL